MNADPENKGPRDIVSNSPSPDLGPILESVPNTDLDHASRMPGRAPSHAGRRRRRITGELIRCAAKLILGTWIREPIPCKALVWNTPEARREHLQEHISPDEINSMDDSQIAQWYIKAARIAQEGIPDNDDE